MNNVQFSSFQLCVATEHLTHAMKKLTFKCHLIITLNNCLWLVTTIGQHNNLQFFSQKKKYTDKMIKVAAWVARLVNVEALKSLERMVGKE